MAGVVKPRTGGFTLVELLVVIAIVGILANLIFPGLARGKTKAAGIRCVSNLRQWGVALSIYTSENDDFIPRRGQGVQQLFIVDRPEDWFNALPKAIRIPGYLQLIEEGKAPRPRENNIFVCPAAVATEHTNFLAYAMNIYLSPTARPQPHRMSEISDPTTLVFMADGPGDYSSTAPSSRGYSVKARHGQSANVAFLDGHVRGFKGEYLGCDVGDPLRTDVRWQTGTSGVNQSPVP